MTTELRALHEQVDHNFTNHPPVNDAVAAAFDEATRRFIELAHWLVDNIPPGVEQDRALARLEECSMQAKAGLARHQDPGIDPAVEPNAGYGS